MKVLFVLLFATAAHAMMAHAGTEPGGQYQVNVSASDLTWYGYKVTGQHHGSIDLKSGSLNFENGQLVGGEFVIDMTTIRNADMAGSGGAEKLEGHLKSDDFFGVSRYPTATLTLTKVIPYGTAGDYKITGDLTIKGTTKPVKFMAKVSENGGGLVATAEITVDRSEYDVRYGSGSFFDNLGDKAISDEFELKVNLALNPA